jgi:hypothetical protein
VRLGLGTRQSSRDRIDWVVMKQILPLISLAKEYALKTQLRLLGVSLVLAIGLLNGGCWWWSPRITLKVPTWSQSHADVANSGQSLVGAPAKPSKAIVAQLGIIAASSAVLGPDQSVYIGTSFAGSDASTSELVHLSGTTLAILQKVRLGGVLSTPAVDRDGNVYIAQINIDGSGAHLLSFSADLKKRNFDIALPAAHSVSSPKILPLSSGSLIFEAYDAAFGSLLIVNEQGKKLVNDDKMCSIVTGGIRDFGPPGIDGINLPSAYTPSVGIRAVQERYYLVLASNRCAIQFYTLQVGQTSADVPTLTRSASADGNGDNNKYYSSPAISLDGTVVINDSEKNTTAYDITTTTGQPKWQHQTSGDLFTTPALLPGAINKVYLISSELLTKLDLATGQGEGAVELAGPTEASPATAGNYIFISKKSGLLTYDLNFAPVAFAPLAGGYSSPAIGADGQVYIGAKDGRFYLFPGP